MPGRIFIGLASLAGVALALTACGTDSKSKAEACPSGFSYDEADQSCIAPDEGDTPGTGDHSGAVDRSANATSATADYRASATSAAASNDGICAVV